MESAVGRAFSVQLSAFRASKLASRSQKSEVVQWPTLVDSPLAGEP
jgi:hypothetical protein